MARAIDAELPTQVVASRVNLVQSFLVANNDYREVLSSCNHESILALYLVSQLSWFVECVQRFSLVGKLSRVRQLLLVVVSPAIDAPVLSDRKVVASSARYIDCRTGELDPLRQ